MLIFVNSIENFQMNEQAVSKKDVNNDDAVSDKDMSQSFDDLKKLPVKQANEMSTDSSFLSNVGANWYLLYGLYIWF